jgi:hypothetical protein
MHGTRIKTIKLFTSSRLRWANYVTHMLEKEEWYRILIGKSEVRRPLLKIRT